MLFATSKIDDEFWKFNIIYNVSNIIIYCCIDDRARKNKTKRFKSLFIYMGKIKEKDVYICKSVTALVKLPNTRKKSCLKTDWCVHWSFKEKQTLRDITLSNEGNADQFRFNKLMSQNEHGIECTPVTDADISVSKTSTRYGFTPFFFFFTFHI